tara:strand:- start:446 stop:649 length:204 start_codon:yes stop_codon:yes gene_type:complete
MMPEYKVSVHYDEGTVLTIEADNASEACEKANKILLDEAHVAYQSEYAPNVVHRDYMVVECEEWKGG